MANWKCPKCRDGYMRQMGFDSCNWRCERCGYKQYVARPKSNVRASIAQSRSTLDGLQAEANRASAEAHDAIYNMKLAEIERRHAREAQKRAKRNARPATKFEKFCGIVFLLMLLYVLFL